MFLSRWSIWSEDIQKLFFIHLESISMSDPEHFAPPQEQEDDSMLQIHAAANLSASSSCTEEGKDPYETSSRAAGYATSDLALFEGPAVCVFGLFGRFLQNKCFYIVLLMSCSQVSHLATLTGFVALWTGT